MPRDLLVGVNASITGQWCRVEPAGKKTWPFRVTFVGGTGGAAWTAGNVILEELSGGLPTSPTPMQGNPGSLTAGSQSGTVVQLGSFPAGAPDFDIDMPVEFIRARTDANINAGATVSVRLLEAE